MGHSQYDPVDDRTVWNSGRKLGAKRPLKPQQIWAIRFMLDREKRVRDRALFDLAIDSKLRGCDLVKVQIGELVRGSHPEPGDCYPAEDEEAGAVRAFRASANKSARVAGAPRRHLGGICLSEPS